jgi:UDP-N-acetylglucosamine 2-epimerase (non-hydrolysing)
MKKKILCVIGTRPEVIKMAPIISLLKKDKESNLRILSTSQHRDMLDQMLDVFKIVPDIDLNLMQENQTLAQLTSNLPVPLHETLLKEKPDIVLAQGDTTTAFMVSLASFYQQIPFGHVEAGLRTGYPYNPFPEEMNRILISRLSTLNFAPTEEAKHNLIKEGYSNAKIFVTGNTVIDALNHIIKKDIPVSQWIKKDKKLILVTAHRRENFGEKLENICRALRAIADKYQDVQILFPVHPNPQVSSVVTQRLSNHQRILLTKPLPYLEFVKTMQLAHFIISDSGGVQEEAPALGKPVLVIRETTERPEGVTLGASKIVGTNSDNIVKETQMLLEDHALYQKMVVPQSPYGDGKASERIILIVKEFLKRK